MQDFLRVKGTGATSQGGGSCLMGAVHVSHAKR